MSEHFPTNHEPAPLIGSTDSLEQQIAAKFAHLSTQQLMTRMERAEDFNYDDEAIELNRRLLEYGESWKWQTVDGRDRVVSYSLMEAQG